MARDSFYQTIAKKAFEITYALLRLAERNTRNNLLSSHLQQQALDLLGSITSEDYEKAGKTLKTVEYYTRLAVELDFITLKNGQILVAEMRSLEALLETQGQFNHQDMVQLFSRPTLPDLIGSTQDMETVRAIEPLPPATSPSVSFPETDFSNERSFIRQNDDPAIELPFKTAIRDYSSQKRQMIVLQKIKANGNCRLREIQDFLPDISDRTLRYDIQKLIEDGLIERMGGGGPAAYYRPKNAAASRE